MQKRFVSIWFPYLKTDWFSKKKPALKQAPFVLAAPQHGRLVITAVSPLAAKNGIHKGMAVADARSIEPGLEVLDDRPGLPEKLLRRFAEWCIRYAPCVAVDLPDGLLIDASGCPHLWGGETPYLTDIINRLNNLGYACQAAMADTIGAAWAFSHYGGAFNIIKKNDQAKCLLSLPPEGLRLNEEILDRLHKLGLHQIQDFINLPLPSLRRRFGQEIIKRINQALGKEEEFLIPVLPVESYTERIPCFEPITSREGVETALQKLLAALCKRLRTEEKGIRQAVLKCFRTDGKTVSATIGTNRAVNQPTRLFNLFLLKLDQLSIENGVELFLLEAQQVEDLAACQEKLWDQESGVQQIALMELLDRFMGRFGVNRVRRFLPEEHYWPERSVKSSVAPDETTPAPWKVDRPRPLRLLPKPEPIEVTAPIPDYPPMLFRYKGQLHKIIKADGPERIEQEWWIEDGQHRDYYCVEDEAGQRYWLFRLGHYDAEKTHSWFLHGFFA